MRDDKEKLQKILECLDRISKYTSNGKDDFFRNYLIQDGVVRNLQIIGEAVKELSSELKDQNPHVSWSRAARMRDKVTHDYFDVNYEIVWDTVENSLPLFRISIQSIYQKIKINSKTLLEKPHSDLEEMLKEEDKK